MSYVFILRLQSEALPARRASLDDELLKRPPLSGDSHALIGHRILPGRSERIVLKLRTRKATRGGAVLMRPCFCDGGDLGGMGICPVRDFGPAVCASSLWGGFLSPSLRSKKTNRMLKGMLRPTKVDQADSYSTRAFRRGASAELKNSGSSFAHVLKTVGWNSATFRAYVSYVEDEEVNIRSILANFDGFESPDKEFGHDASSADLSGDASSASSSDDIPISTLNRIMGPLIHWVNFPGMAEFSLGFAPPTSNPTQLGLINPIITPISLMSYERRFIA